MVKTESTYQMPRSRILTGYHNHCINNYKRFARAAATEKQEPGRARYKQVDCPFLNYGLSEVHAPSLASLSVMWIPI